jgi:hypothetical protein
VSDRSKITHVAIKFQGITYSLPAPNRHHDVIRHIIETTGVETVNAYDENQGFLDESGRYLNRTQALGSAMLNNQIKPGVTPKLRKLFSEDVW